MRGVASSLRSRLLLRENKRHISVSTEAAFTTIFMDRTLLVSRRTLINVARRPYSEATSVSPRLCLARSAESGPGKRATATARQCQREFSVSASRCTFWNSSGVESSCVAGSGTSSEHGPGQMTRRSTSNKAARRRNSWNQLWRTPFSDISHSNITIRTSKMSQWRGFNTGTSEGAPKSPLPAPDETQRLFDEDFPESLKVEVPSEGIATLLHLLKEAHRVVKRDSRKRKTALVPAVFSAKELLQIYRTIFASAPQQFSRESFEEIVDILPDLFAEEGHRARATRIILADMASCGVQPTVGHLENLMDLSIQARDPDAMLWCYQALKNMEISEELAIPQSLRATLKTLGISDRALFYRDPIPFLILYLFARRGNSKAFYHTEALLGYPYGTFGDLDILLCLRRRLFNAALAKYFDRSDLPENDRSPLETALALRAASEGLTPRTAMDIFESIASPMQNEVRWYMDAVCTLKHYDVALVDFYGKLKEKRAFDRANVLASFLAQTKFTEGMEWYDAEILALGWGKDPPDKEELLAGLAALAAGNVDRTFQAGKLHTFSPTFLAYLRKVLPKVDRMTFLDAAFQLGLNADVTKVDNRTYTRIRDRLAEKKRIEDLEKWLELFQNGLPVERGDGIGYLLAAWMPPLMPDQKGWNRLAGLVIVEDNSESFTRISTRMTTLGIPLEQINLDRMVWKHVKDDQVGIARSIYETSIGSDPMVMSPGASTFEILLLSAFADARKSGIWDPATKWWRECVRQGHVPSVAELLELTAGIEEIVCGPVTTEKQLVPIGSVSNISPSVPLPIPTRPLTVTETLVTSMLSIFSPEIPDNLPKVLVALGDIVLRVFGKKSDEQRKHTERFLNSLARIVDWTENGPKIGDVFQIRTEAWKRDYVVRVLVPAIIDTLGTPVIGQPIPGPTEIPIVDRIFKAVVEEPAIFEWNIRHFYGTGRDAETWLEHSAGKEAEDSARRRVRESFIRLLIHSRQFGELSDMLDIPFFVTQSQVRRNGLGLELRDNALLERERLMVFHLLSRMRDQEMHLVKSFAAKYLRGAARVDRFPLAPHSALHEFELASMWRTLGDAIGWDRRAKIPGVLGNPVVDWSRAPEWLSVTREKGFNRDPEQKQRWRGLYSVTPI